MLYDPKVLNTNQDLREGEAKCPYCGRQSFVLREDVLRTWTAFKQDGKTLRINEQDLETDDSEFELACEYCGEAITFDLDLIGQELIITVYDD